MICVCMYISVCLSLFAVAYVFVCRSLVLCAPRHSMGGHGAIMMYLRNSDKYRSVSALAPICHPSESLLGLKCFGNYLGEDGEGRAAWRSYDSTEIMRARARSGAPPLPVNILIDQGYEDIFYTEKTLLPEHFVEACESAGQQVWVIFHRPET